METPDQQETEFSCPMCGCTEVAWAERLGNLLHCCCRDCHWIYDL